MVALGPTVESMAGRLTVRTLDVVNATVAAILGGVLGLVTGAISVSWVRRSEPSPRTVLQTPDPGTLPAGVSDVLAVLRSGAIVLDAADAVVSTSPPAVANDDPEAVARFAHRMQVESTRLTRLVQEIVDLSRLEIAGTLHDPELVDVGVAAAEAIDQSRLVAGSRGAEIVSSLARDAYVFGDADLLVTAVRNLVGNAINYSAPGARVAVSVRSCEQLVEVAVADQGQGIPESEQARIFERFYRVDAARSRATGGTGLGLAIVKHICANHGGEVTVWSEPWPGSLH